MSVQRSSKQPPTAVADFVQDLFAQLPRADQRRWARAYLHGLLTVPGRKSLQRLAAAVSESPTASQSLQQFLNASPWDWMPVREALAGKVTDALPVHAWTVGPAALPKRGDHSVGVHRRFVPEAGRTINCQVGIGLFLSTGSYGVPVDWRILLTEDWYGDPDRLRRARVPKTLRNRPAWSQVLDLVGGIPARRVAPPAPLLIDLRGLGGAAELADALTRKGLCFLIEIPPGQFLVPHFAQASLPAQALSAQALARRGRSPWGQQAAMTSALVRFPAAGSGSSAGTHVYRLWTGRASTASRTARHWITGTVDAGAEEIRRLLPHASLARSSVKALEDDFGLHDFEGRSFPGWHHHMTMVSAAYAYRCLASESRRAGYNVRIPRHDVVVPLREAGSAAGRRHPAVHRPRIAACS
ncbi:IS701 family transposase [Streptomyces chattanoogensis]|uniref:GbdB n=1 Tax=Streptomyces chattanoogensis TaxID=66876 RepID=F8SUS2_9ACTN|nr:GbdB [Streptomyces chattanoogensis]